MLGRDALRRSGVTLVETLVALGIAILLFGIALAYNRSSNDQLVVYSSQAQLVGFINRAKAFALERRSSVQNICALGVHYRPAGGGVEGAFIIFEDLAAEDLDCPDGANGQFDGFAEQKEVLAADPRLAVTAFPGDIIFRPPYLQTDYVSNYNELGLVKIEIPGGAAACVAVGPGGAIYALSCPEDFDPGQPPV